MRTKFWRGITMKAATSETEKMERWYDAFWWKWVVRIGGSSKWFSVM